MGSHQSVSTEMLSRYRIEIKSEKLVQSGGGSSSDVWYEWWELIIRLSGKHYDLPGGSIGCKYLSTREVQHLVVYPADQLIVFVHSYSREIAW